MPEASTGLSLTEILTIAATALGPIIGVIFTLWYQDFSAGRATRANLFATMMRLRRDTLNTDFVGALNLVPVHFSKKQPVMARYANLMTVFEDQSWRSQDPHIRAAIYEKAELAIAYLLSEMSKVVGSPVEQLHILRGAYAPQGWSDDRQLAREMQLAAKSILTGARRLPVDVFGPPPPQEGGTQASDPPALPDDVTATESQVTDKA